MGGGESKQAEERKQIGGKELRNVEEREFKKETRGHKERRQEDETRKETKERETSRRRSTHKVKTIEAGNKRGEEIRQENTKERGRGEETRVEETRRQGVQHVLGTAAVPSPVCSC